MLYAIAMGQIIPTTNDNSPVPILQIWYWCTSTSTRMWANAQRDGRPTEHRWRPLFNAAKFCWRSLLDCHAVTLPRRESHWN